MDRNIGEIIKKMIDGSNNEYEILNKNYLDNIISVEEFFLKLTNYTYRVWLTSLIEFNDEKSKSELLIWLFLKPDVIMNRLNSIKSSIKHINSFIEWYFKEFILFFKNSNNKNLFVEKHIFLSKFTDEKYGKFNALQTKCINSCIEILNCNIIDLESLTSKESIENFETIFDKFSSMATVIEDAKNNGISYTAQYEMLKILGVSQELIEKLLYENIRRLDKYPKKNDLQVEIILKNDTKNEEIIGIPLGKTEIEKTNNKRKKALLEELKEYYPKNEIIEGEVFGRIMEIVSELYSKEEVSNIKNNILFTNQKLKQEKVINAKQELLSEENLVFMEFMTSILYSNNYSFVAYIPLIQDSVSEVTLLINEYIALEDSDKAYLKEVYQEQINLSLDKLKVYGLCMPVDLIDHNARK